MRRFWSVLLAAVLGMCLGVMAPAAYADSSVTVESKSFVDVPANRVFYSEISWLANQGVSTGWSVGGGEAEFRSLSSTARDAMAAFLYRLAGSPDFAPPKVSPFSDVPRTQTFYKEITWLASTGIATGWKVSGGGTEFRPQSPVARDAMAAFLYRFAESQLGKDVASFSAPAVASFVDVPVGRPFYREIAWLASTGVSTGWDVGGGESEFRPMSQVARDAMAAFMFRLSAESNPIDASDPDAGSVQVAPNAMIISDGQVGQISVEGSIIELPANANLSGVLPGDVLVAGVSDQTPQGLLTRVESVTTHSDGRVSLQISPADLTDVITQTDTPISVEMTPVSATFTPAEGASEVSAPGARSVSPTLTKSIQWSKTYTLSGQSSTGALSGTGSVGVNLNATAALGADLDLDVSPTGITQAGVSITPSVSTTNTITANGSFAGSATAPLGALSTVFTFQVGIIPIVITADTNLSTTITVSGNAQASVTASASVSSTHGFSYKNGAFTLINTRPALDMSKSGYLADVLMNARASLDTDAVVKLYGMAGITFGAGPYTDFAVTVDADNGNTTWACPFNLGIQTRVGVVAQLSVWGFTLPAWDKSASQAWNLWTKQLCERSSDPTKPSNTLKITTTSLSSAIAGQAYTTQLTATGGTPPYTWSASGLPAGLSIDPTTGTLTGTPIAESVTTITVTLVDAGGKTANKVFSLDTVTPQSVLTFADRNLQACVAGSLGISTDSEIDLNQARNITSLDCGGGMEIRDINGIEKLSNLVDLDLSQNQRIADITPLAGLVKLEGLDLSWNEISDIGPLKGLTDLKYLSVAQNQIADVAPLSQLSNLKTLLAGHNQISDLTPLEKFDQIETLSLVTNKIVDLTPIKYLRSIKILVLDDNPISSLSPLSSLTGLNELTLGWVGLSDISPLSSLVNLTRLDLERNKIEDIRPISSLTNLTNLSIDHNQIFDLRPLNGLVSLEYLDARTQQVTITIGKIKAGGSITFKAPVDADGHFFEPNCAYAGDCAFDPQSGDVTFVNMDGSREAYAGFGGDFVHIGESTFGPNVFDVGVTAVYSIE